MASKTKLIRAMHAKANHDDSDLPVWFNRHLKRYPVLSPEAEYDLLVRVAAGDDEAKRLLVEHNLRLVMFVARRYASPGMDYEDLFQEGIPGLMKAIEKFKIGKGKKLSTYATWWIRQSISRAVMDQGRVIRLPVFMQSESKREDREQMPGTWSPLSLEADASALVIPMHDGAPMMLSDVVPDPTEQTDEAAIANVDREAAPTLLASLFKKAGIPEQHRHILLMRAGGAPLEDIGKMHRLTRERVRQIVTRDLAKLQKAAGVNISDFFSTSKVS